VNTDGVYETLILPSGVLEVTVKGGEKMFDTESVNRFVVQDVNAGKYIKHRVKSMNKEAEKAVSELEYTSDALSAAVKRFLDIGRTVDESSKNASSKVRVAADKLSNGLAKIEKIADMSKLEQYVELLERAAKAITVLGDLHDSGKLEKIAVAIR